MKIKSTDWRVIWHQHVDGRTLVKWHTGPRAEVDLFLAICQTAGEPYWLSAPGTFK